MGKHAQQTAIPLVKWRIDEIISVAREAGRTAFSNAGIARALWMDARSHWLTENLPSALGLTDDEFDAVIVRSAGAFKDGVDEYLRDMDDVTETRAPRFPGMSYFFSENNDFAYGLQIDLSRFSVERFDVEALYQRVYPRLMGEYHRLAPHIATARGVPGLYQPEPGDEPISTFMLVDDVFVFRIVPVALDRDMLAELLPAKLREFVTYMIGTEECHE